MILDFSNKELFNYCYIPLLYNKTRFLHLFGSAGSGKSVFGGQKEIIFSFREERRNRKTLIVRKVFGTLKNSVFSQLKNQIYEWNLQDCFSFTVSPLSITNKITGVQFIFVGLDDVEKIKSVQGVDRIYIEEATELSTINELDQLSLRLRGFSEVQITLAYNPINVHHWLNTEIHQKPAAGHFVFKSTYKDNRFLDAAYKEFLDSLKDSNPNYYNVYGLGNWGQNQEGLIYPAYQTATVMPIVQGYGLDFGFNDPTALVEAAITDNPNSIRKSLYLNELLYKTHLTSDAIIAELNKLGINKNLPLICDNARPEIIKDLRKAGYNAKPCVKGAGSVQSGITQVKKHDIFIVIGSKNLFKEMDNWSWENKNGIWLDVPESNGVEHLLDASRYFTQHFSKGGGTVAGF